MNGAATVVEPTTARLGAMVHALTVALGGWYWFTRGSDLGDHVYFTGDKPHGMTIGPNGWFAYSDDDANDWVEHAPTGRRWGGDMFYGVGNWNSYLDGVLYINDANKQILQVYLRTMLGTAGAKGVLGDISGNLSDASSLTEETMKMVTITVSVIPVLIVYPFLQKYYTKGILIGSVKG